MGPRRRGESYAREASHDPHFEYQHHMQSHMEPDSVIPPPHVMSVIETTEPPAIRRHSHPDHLRTLRSETVSSTSSYSTERSIDRCQTLHRITDPITDQEIKFTKTTGCTPSTCLCLLVAVLLIMLGASSGIYFGLKSYNGKSLRERVFKGHFVITRGESYDPRFEEAASEKFRDVSLKYRDVLNKLFNTSKLHQSFMRSEVIALEKAKEGSDDVVVHFNLHFKPYASPNLNSADVYIILATEILRTRQGLFSSISIDPSSLDITERRDSVSSSPFLFYPFYPKSDQRPTAASRESSYGSYYRNPWETKARFPGVLEGLVTEPSPPVRRCQKIDISFCASVLPYKETSYPNIMGHWNASSVEASFVDFRQFMDAECFPLSREYICRILQPECVDDDLVYPCRDFCKDFGDACGKWIPREDKKGLFDRMTKCDDFPRFDGDDGEGEKGRQTSNSRPAVLSSRVIYFDEEIESKSAKKEKRKCRSKSGCEHELKMRGRSHHVCDGIIDCNDLSDEAATCDYCSPPNTRGSSSKNNKMFYCGNKQCVEERKVCDAIIDCNNGADEQNCLRLRTSISIRSSSNNNNNSKNDAPYYQTSGVLASKIRGKDALVCVEKFENVSIPLHRKSYLLDRMGTSVCATLGYHSMISSEPDVNTDRSTLFSTIDEMNVDGIRLRLSETACNSRQIVRITCDSETLECGRNPLFTAPDQRSRAVLTSSLQKIYEQFDRPIDLLPGSVFAANDGDWPWLVSLFKDGQFLCEGTLIDSQWILTSSSCFEETPFRSSGQWRAVLGTVRLSSRSPLFAQERDILSLVHSRSDHRKNSFHLSLLKMESSFNASDFVRQVCVHQATLSTTELRKLAGVDCFTTAWDISNDRLQFIKVNIVEESDCDSLIENNDRELREISFCARVGHIWDGLVTMPGRALYCATSHNLFSVVGIEAMVNTKPRIPEKASSTSLHLFVRTTHQSEWIRQVVDSYRRSSSTIHEVRMPGPREVTVMSEVMPHNQHEISVERQPVYSHETSSTPPPVTLAHDLNWSPENH